MEIAAGKRAIVIREDDRIVGHRAGFDGQRARRILQQVERRAHHLRLAAEAVGVLDPAAGDMAGQDLAAVEQAGDRGGDADLPGLAAKLRNARVERLRRAFERIDRQRAGGDRGGEHALAQEQGVERQRGARLRAVDQRQAFLRAELQRFEAEPFERGGGGNDLAGQVDPAIAHQRRDQVRERREVAAGADAALRRDQRHGVGVEQPLQRLDHERPNARMAAAEPEQLQDDHQPRHVARQRIAEAGAVRQDQVGLQLGQAFGRDARVGEQAEAGVDAIDGLAAGDDALDRRRRSRRRAASMRRRAGPPRRSTAGAESSRSMSSGLSFTHPPSANRGPARARSRSRCHSPHRRGA